MTKDQIIDRLKDYKLKDQKELFRELQAAWRELHPSAVSEVSKLVAPLIKSGFTKSLPDEPDEEWYNDIYSVTVRRNVKNQFFPTDKPCVLLGIASFDVTAPRDFRDMQQIKNQL